MAAASGGVAELAMATSVRLQMAELSSQSMPVFLIPGKGFKIL